MKKTHLIRTTALFVPLTAAAALSSMTGCMATPANVAVAAPASTEVAPAPGPTTMATTPVVASAATPEPSALEPEVAPVAHVTTELAPQKLDDEHAPRTLIALREELFRFHDDGQAAFANVGHFRPLCDANGYPVVGNVIRKMSGYQTSTFCSELRSRGERK